jgi:hypothetical protein
LETHFGHAGHDAFLALAYDESIVLNKLERDEAINVLFAFALRDRLIQPNEQGNDLSISASGNDLTVSVVLPDSRKATETLDLSEALDWDNDDISADGYARAMVKALEAANQVEPRSKLP